MSRPASSLLRTINLWWRAGAKLGGGTWSLAATVWREPHSRDAKQYSASGKRSKCVPSASDAERRGKRNCAWWSEKPYPSKSGGLVVTNDTFFGSRSE